LKAVSKPWLSLIALCLILHLIGKVQLFAQNRMVAEWEPMQGVLIRHPFGIPLPLIRSLAELDTVYILVANSTAQSQASYTLSSVSVNLANCRFVLAPTDSHWTRDWGPQSIFLNDSQGAIADPYFDGYPWVPGLLQQSYYDADDAVNGILANHMGVPLLSFPGYLTGGNFMCDGYSTAYSTAQMLNENTNLMTPSQFLEISELLLGITDFRFTINPEVNGIQHIDCWAKLLNEETVLVKQLPLWHPEYARAEAIAALFAQDLSCFGRPYQVIRIFCDTYSGSNAAAYTNSLILNKRVFVPTFGIAADQTALQTYADAMPGYEILGFDGAWYYYDALHCRTMGIADMQMLRITHHPPAQLTEIIGNAITITAGAKSYGNFPLLPGYPKLTFKRNIEAQWESMPMAPSEQEGLYEAVVTQLADGAEFQYSVSATDASGRYQSLPITAPEQYFSTVISAPTAVDDSFLKVPQLQIYPLPVKDYLHIESDSKSQFILSVKLYDLRGRLVQTITLPPGSVRASLDMRAGTFASGIYFIKIHTSLGTYSHKVTLIK